MGIRRGGVNFFVGVRDFESMLVLENRKQRHSAQRRTLEAAELGGMPIAGFDGKRFVSAEPQSFQPSWLDAGSASRAATSASVSTSPKESNLEETFKPRPDVCSV